MRAEITADSITETGCRLTTFIIRDFWKLLQAEMRTHRSLSQSHYSSRAIPIAKVMEQVRERPFIPRFTQYQKGMGGTDTLGDYALKNIQCEARTLRFAALGAVEYMQKNGCAKQEANRYLEPWMTGDLVVTGDYKAWNGEDGFFSLRCTSPEQVQPDMYYLACEMRELWQNSKPDYLQEGEWHIAMMLPEERGLELSDRLIHSVARCARTSYNREGVILPIEKDVELENKLWKDKHLTPFEHQAVATGNSLRYANFTGFQSLRNLRGR